MSSISIGIDEVGRGALAGPVVVCAAGFSAIDKKTILENLTVLLKRAPADSKKLTRSQREKAADYLRTVLVWNVGEATSEEIDGNGLTAALTKASDRALQGLQKQGYVITNIEADAGLHHSYESLIPTTHQVKGDENIHEIMFASIIAKVHRDKIMTVLALEYPEYDWHTNAGYGSATHFTALTEKGVTPHHRQLFLRKFKREVGTS